MNLYFSCSLTGGRGDEAIYAAIVEHLEAEGHEVFTAHLAYPSVMELEKVSNAQEVYERDVRWMEECEALIAEVTTPSHGVGYEIAYTLGLNKPVLCCYREDMKVSKMILGNDSPGLVVQSYESVAQALGVIDEFLAGLQ